MNILTTSTSSQNLIFIPRFDSTTGFQPRVVADGGTYTLNGCYTPLFLNITNEDTKVSTTYDVSATSSNQELTIAQAFTLTEGVYYSYEVLNGLNLMYRGKIFCTDQTDFDKYVISSGDFVEAASRDNEFITP